MYKNPVNLKLYSLWNKDKRINKYFRSTSVGKCMKLIDDYYHSTDLFCAAGWEKYYLTPQREDRLGDVIKEIAPILKASEEDVYDYVFYRVLGQTYNGYLVELNIIDELQNEFPELDMLKATYELDEKYFTDFECYSNDTLVFGSQIKPISYKYMSTPYQKRAKQNHEEQRKAYIHKYKAPHFMIFYDNGEIIDKEKILDKINIILHFQII